MTHCDVHLTLEEPKWESTVPHLHSLCQKVINHVFHKCFVDTPKPLEISLVFTDNLTLQKLNHHYRHKDKVTNVLSFPTYALDDGNEWQCEDSLPLGDLIFALEKLVEEAQEAKKTLKAHLSHLIIHGTLHLLGYTHEDDEDALAMETLEIQMMQTLGFANPYKDSQ